MTLEMLYSYAEQRGISVHHFPMEELKSLALGSGNIALNAAKIETQAEEKVLLAHELGHCETGSLYGSSSTRHTRLKCESKADRWAIACLVPVPELCSAFEQGLLTPWEIAEHLDVTEELVVKSLEYYISVKGIDFNISSKTSVLPF